MTLYGATKAFVLFLSQGLILELGPRGVYVQAVLPAATRTEFWGRAGVDVDSLPEEPRWHALEGARQALLSDIRQAHAAERYRRQS